MCFLISSLGSLDVFIVKQANLLDACLSLLPSHSGDNLVGWDIFAVSGVYVYSRKGQLLTADGILGCQQLF